DELSGPVAALPRRAVHGGGAVHSRRRGGRGGPPGPAAAAVAGGPAAGRAAWLRGRDADAHAMTGGAIIYLEDVTVDYDGFKALSHLNFFMDRRELRVVIGPNGAGKTTLLDVISGRVKPAGGRVIFGHHTDLVKMRENEIAALGIGRKFQTPSVFVNLSVWDNVELSLKRPSKGVFAALLERNAAGERERIAATLSTVGLGDKASVPAGVPSHGDKQCLEIGMVMA